MRREQVHDPPVRHDHALGPAGRPGGVDHVRRVAGGHPGRRSPAAPGSVPSISRRGPGHGDVGPPSAVTSRSPGAASSSIAVSRSAGWSQVERQVGRAGRRARRRRPARSARGAAPAATRSAGRGRRARRSAAASPAAQRSELGEGPLAPAATSATAVRGPRRPGRRAAAGPWSPGPAGGVVPARADRGPVLGRGQHADRGERRVRRVADPGQHQGQPVQQRPAAARSNRSGAVLQVEVQPVRRAARSGSAGSARSRAPTPVTRRRRPAPAATSAERVVLEDRQRVEQLAVPGQPLDLGQPEVLVVHQPRPARPAAGAAGRPPARPGPARTRTGMVLMNRPIIDSTPGSSGGRPATVAPNTHVVAAGQRAEQRPPGALDDGVQREPARPGQLR